MRHKVRDLGVIRRSQRPNRVLKKDVMQKQS